MTIGKETIYFGGLIQGEWDDLPSGTILPLNDKGHVREIKVVDANTLAFKIRVDDIELEERLVGEEINASGFQVGPSNFREMILGKSTRIYWDPDLPDRDDMEPVKPVVWRLQSSGI